MHPKINEMQYLKENEFKIRHLTGDFTTSHSHRHTSCVEDIRMTYNVKQLFFQFDSSVHPAYKNRPASATWLRQPTSQKKVQVSPI